MRFGDVAVGCSYAVAGYTGGSDPLANVAASGQGENGAYSLGPLTLDPELSQSSPERGAIQGKSTRTIVSVVRVSLLTHKRPRYC